MALLLRRGPLPLLGIAAPVVRTTRGRRASTGLLPSLSASDRGETTDDEFFQGDARPILLFDGVCNMCNGGVRFVTNNDRNRRIRYEPLQSQAGRKLLVRSGRSPDDISSMVLVEKDRSYIKSEALRRIMEYLDLPFPLLAQLLNLVPLFMRDFAYDNVANNRYLIFGKSETGSCDL
ncbi:hypothetical protein HPP92_021449 [Vanilla planifolia]|uniref:DCC family protein n=1 Tax=Vanilla planifolia TaxID=51239 RepID=A0A835Q1K5_VANPL|nr:hypothetical protein HPP92_021449 [Vanilla planifolia]